MVVMFFEVSMFILKEEGVVILVLLCYNILEKFVIWDKK